VVSANDKIIVGIRLSGGKRHDGPEGRKSIETAGASFESVPLLMDKAYEGDETRNLAAENGRAPAAPPKKNRKNPWEYDHELYKRRNMIERFFRRVKEFRKVFTRYDKLDIMFFSVAQFVCSLLLLN
jgi:transposase